MASVTASRASLVGDSVTCTGLLLTCDPASATVGGSVEFDVIIGVPVLTTADVGSNSITLQGNFFVFIGDLNPVSLTIGDLDSTLGNITGVALSVTNITGLTLGDISFTADSVTVNINNTEWARDVPSSALITLCFADSDAACAAAAVPAPSTLSVLSLGAVLAGAAVRRFRRSRS
jgi:hypothetical protein